MDELQHAELEDGGAGAWEGDAPSRPPKTGVRYTVYSFGGWPNSWDTAGLGAAADVLWNILEMDGSPPGKMC